MVMSSQVFKEHVIEQGCDIIGLSETWLSTEITNETIFIPNYAISRNNTVGRGGGVAIHAGSALRSHIVS